MLRPILMIMLAVLVSACQDDSVIPPPAGASTTKYSVSMANIEKQDRPVIYSVPATIVAKNQLQLASRVTAYIDPGVVLVSVDGTQVEAAIRGVEAAIVAARAELEDVEDDLKRYHALSETQALTEGRLRDAAVRVQVRERLHFYSPPVLPTHDDTTFKERISSIDI